MGAGAPPSIGASAEAAPTSPSENVQMVSTQPELPVFCCTTQASAISTDSASAMPASASTPSAPNSLGDR